MSLKSYLLAGLIALLPLASPALAEPAASQILPLESALTLAFEKSPVLGASSARASAASAEAVQAGALPNPDLGIDAENIYGNGAYDGTNNAEITYGVSQLIELPGKRAGRVGMAEAGKDISGHARAATRHDLIRDLTIAYAEAVASEQKIAILAEELKLATEIRDSVAARVDAGKEPAIQKNKADIQRLAGDIALERERRALQAKRQHLAALIGITSDGFTLAADSLPLITPPDALEIYTARLAANPDALGFGAGVIQARATLAYEKAAALPDPTLNFGVRDLREDDAQALVMGVSFPLPVFNLNRAGVERAGHQLNAVMLDQQGAQLSLSVQLAQAYAEFSSAYAEADTLKTAVLPGAEEAFSFARQGYEAGKFGYLDVLDAQRTLFDVRRQLSDTILTYHRSRADVERLAISSTPVSKDSQK